MQTAFFSTLRDLIDLRHPLAVLYHRVDWNKIHQDLKPLIVRKPSLQKIVETGSLFENEIFSFKAKPSHAGRPRIDLQILIALTYLKHAFNLSDDALIEQWQQNVYFQYLSGVETFSINPPCDKAQLCRFRQAIGEEGVEILLQATIETAVSMKAISPEDLEHVIVDTTVMEKAIAYPTDSRLLEVARHHIVKAAKHHGIALKQTFAKEGKNLKFQAGRYAHAKQSNRMQRCIRRQRTILGILLREIERKANHETLTLMADKMQCAKRIKTQKKKDKEKLYAFHAPEVECIGKGKARQPYEFGVKTGVAVGLHHSLILGARSSRWAHFA